MITFINCPICRRLQRFEKIGGEWIPVSPFCCDIMRHGDTPEWYTIVDRLLGEGKVYGTRTTSVH